MRKGIKDMNKKAYSEVLSVINSLTISEYKMIPYDVIEYIRWHCDYSYKPNYDSSKSLEEQNFSRESITLILKIFYEYFATSEQKEDIREKIRLQESKIEKEKRKKYNPDDLF